MTSRSAEPRRVCVLGAGPIGVEAALACRDAGFGVTVFERGEVGEHLRRWGHVRMFSPWSLNTSALGRALAAATGRTFPASDVCPTGHEFVRGYVAPLAATLGSALRIGHDVRMVGRKGLLKGDLIGDPRRATHPFRILARDPAGVETVTEADLVLDCTGVYRQPGFLGEGGLPAPGEKAVSERIDHGIADIEGSGRRAYAGRRILLVGGGHSAATTALALERLCVAEPATRVLWLVRSRERYVARPDDPLPERRRLDLAARRLLDKPPPCFEVVTGSIQAIHQQGEALRVMIAAGDRQAPPAIVDRVIGNAGSLPDRDLYRELQIHECYATSGPMKLAASLLASGSNDCMDQPAADANTLSNPEPGFFILGVKSYGRNPAFLLRNGLEQIERVLEILRRSPAEVAALRGES